MTDENNLDKLFQKQLSNLEVTPNKKVWQHVETKLKKKPKTMIPFWWFAGAVAAILILALFIFPFSEEQIPVKKDNGTPIITKIPENKKTDTNTIDTILKPKNTQQEILITEENTTINNNHKNPKTLPKEKIIVAEQQTENIKNKEELVSTKNAMKKIFLADNSPKIKTDSIENNSLVITDNSAKKKQTFLEIKTKTNEENRISKKENFTTYINKKDSVSVDKKIENKWSVAPVFGVLNSNSFSNTSPIDKNLASSTQGKNTISYGVKVAFKLNKKWTLQSGIHLQEMSFTNNKIAVNSANTSSIIFNGGDQFSFVKSSNNSINTASNSIINTVSLNGNLNQKYGYLEIPVEVKYKLNNSQKISTQVVAGFSSLFLNKNEINLTTSLYTNQGKANNLNNINFSGNLGFDVNYSFDKNWSLHVNPMFKAQLNTFSEKSNGFSPFNIGVYSGIKYQF
ncbi:hypothetical protein [Polaribacter sp.]|uniref:hypothetical protein n=1 Tax=Polaribacter sp. TaxID=1920175 RepID=UPI003EF175B7